MASGKKNYFRHYYSARNDVKIQDCMDKFGVAGYFYWFVLVELCAEQAADGLPDFYYFHVRSLIKEFKCHKFKLDIILEHFQSISLINFKYNENRVEVSMPNLSKYMGKYSNKTTSNVSKERKEKKRKVNTDDVALSDAFRSDEKKKVPCPAKKELKNLTESVIEYLNKSCGKLFKAEAKANTQFINARISEGYNFDQFKKVIDLKVRQWIHTDMEKYLRPSTLFNATKFESYLNESSDTDTDKAMEDFFIKDFTIGASGENSKSVNDQRTSDRPKSEGKTSSLRFEI